MTRKHNDSPGIVVGVDGSAASAAALRWALARAATDHETVTAVEVQPIERFLPGTSYAPAPYGTAPPAERLHSRLHETVAPAVAAVRNAPEVIETHLHGDPAAELVRTAENASMLVLGHTPHRRITEFLLGRVTAECLRRSGIPVVLVPAGRTVRGPEAG
ncbi:universal stress protein [Actinophytocola gossypii]|uniref:Universal stress protein n=1 Tax=Actinophytocola gossypii TaxID=2812003 RepID=A0ABT2JJ74_9PSEU|nr:universal stress protein [Actinophytocola gossypii]MCT2587932.1 universal stress protein [Actinophytocola gossypii]